MKPIKPVKITARNSFDKETKYGDEWTWFKNQNKLGKICVECGLEKKLIRHHIIRLSQGGRNVEANISQICNDCHIKKHPHMQKQKVRKIRAKF